MSAFSPKSLARSSARHPWLVVVAWVVIVAAAAFATTHTQINDEQAAIGSDSHRADNIIKDAFGESGPRETIVIESARYTVDDPEFRALVQGLVAQLQAMPGTVAFVTSYYENSEAAFVSANRHATIIPVVLTGEVGDAIATVKPAREAVKAARVEGFTVLMVGDGSLGLDWQHRAESDLRAAETFGVPAALIVLLLVFGAAAAAGVPVLLALLGILTAMGLTAVVSFVSPVNTMTANMTTMIGLAVGIDYTLFVLERFREERRGGLQKVGAIAEAGDTASRAVLFSGITVVIGLASLALVPGTMPRGLALGAIAAVVVAVAMAMTLLPAILSIMGDRVNWLRMPWLRSSAKGPQENGLFDRTTRTVQRHPVLATAGSAGLLVGLALPVFAIQLGSPGISDMPRNIESVQAFEILDRDFSAGRLAPVKVVIQGDVNGPAVTRAIEQLRARIAADPNFSGVGELTVSASGSVGVLEVVLVGDTMGSTAQDSVRRLRSDYVPAAFEGSSASVVVGGGPAATVDYVDLFSRYLPIVIGFVLLLSFLLLTMVFRSVVIPLKAITMNLLSVGAAYGLLVLVFQEGVGAGLLGFQQVDSLAAFLPVFLFAILFGLSMDYHVFLLSRIQERYLATGDNTAAVGHGLRSTAHIITGAAAIMIVVFGGFAMGSLPEMQQMGFGLAVAVFLDATVVRSVLVPASMQLLGKWNWYLPSWLEWLPKINVEGAPRAAAGREFGFAPAGGGR